jgi:hypothetical protein
MDSVHVVEALLSFFFGPLISDRVRRWCSAVRSAFTMRRANTRNCRGVKGTVATGTDLRPTLNRAQAPTENECRLLPLAPQRCLTLEVRPRLNLIVRPTPLRRRTSVRW